MDEKSTIIIHPDDFSVIFTLNTFYKSIDNFFHGDGVMTREIIFIYVNCILNQTGRDNINPDLESVDILTGVRYKNRQKNYL